MSITVVSHTDAKPTSNVKQVDAVFTATTYEAGGMELDAGDVGLSAITGAQPATVQGWEVELDCDAVPALVRFYGVDGDGDRAEADSSEPLAYLGQFRIRLEGW